RRRGQLCPQWHPVPRRASRIPARCAGDDAPAARGWLGDDRAVESVALLSCLVYAGRGDEPLPMWVFNIAIFFASKVAGCGGPSTDERILRTAFFMAAFF